MTCLLTRFLPILIVLGFPASARDRQWKWEGQESGVPTSIRALCAVDEQSCWFGTAKGIIGRTTDGGKTWQRTVVAGAEEVEFRDVASFHRDHCLAMSVGAGTASRVYQTLDGGATWKLVQQNEAPEGFYNGMAFWDDNEGILAGDPVDGKLVILRTSDGGASWRAVDATPPMKTGEHAFAASGTHLAVAAGGHVWVGSGGTVARVFYSEDFGKTWSVFETPMIAGQPSTGIFSLAFQDALHGFGVGGDYENESEGKSNAMITSDGGKSWTLLEGGDGTSVFPFRSCVRIIPGSRSVIAIGPEGSSVSTDFGTRWTSFGDQGFHTFSISGPSGAIWAAGSKGRLARLR